MAVWYHRFLKFELQTGYSSRPPTLLQHFMDFHVWSYPGSSYTYQASSKSIQWFRRHGVSKFAISHWLGQSLPYKPWWEYCCRLVDWLMNTNKIEFESASALVSRTSNELSVWVIEYANLSLWLAEKWRLRKKRNLAQRDYCVAAFCDSGAVYKCHYLLT